MSASGVGVGTGIEASFAALPLAALAGAALDRAGDLGATHASFRVQRVRSARSVTIDGVHRGSEDTTDIGLAVQVVAGGSGGFAAADELTPAAARSAAEGAVAAAAACAPLGTGGPGPAAEEVYRDRFWVGAHRVDPFTVTEAERVHLLRRWSRGLLAEPDVEQVLATVTVTRDNTFYADLAGTSTTQQRVRIHPQLTVAGTHRRTGARRTLRTLGPPTARGWEYVSGEGWDWDRELAEMPGQLRGKLDAVPVEPGHYDLVIAPSQLWLTIHESVGHATELDRALGHEASYAGTTFATPDGLGSLRYGSPLMHVTADRTTPHGLATVGFDDEGVAARSWTLVEDGVLVGFQHDRRTAGAIGARRSTGCAFAESARHPPLSRMPNVSLSAAAGGPSVDELISGVESGIYLEGSDSFSIDSRREDFQFSAQRAHRIRGGRVTGQLSGVAYRASTTRFWSALAAVGGEDSSGTFGADLCGKGQPVQVAATSHGSPAALFRGIRVVNTDTGAAP